MRNRPQTLPPGPGWTSLLVLGEDPIYGPVRLHREFGSISYMPIGPGFAPIYVVSDPDMVHQVLVKERDRYVKDRFLKWMAPVFGDGLLITDGEKWERARRMITPAFRPRALRSYGEVMIRATHSAIDRLDVSKGFDSEAWTRDLALDIALESLFGSELGDKAPRVAQALDDLLIFADGVLGRITAPPKKLPLRMNRALWRGMKTMDAVIDEILAERAQSEEERLDLLTMLLGARDGDGSALSPQEVHDQIITLLLAGHETTALSLSYALMLLGWNPAVVKRAQEELDRVVGDRDVTLEDLRKLTYLNQIIQESLRMYPPAAITVRQAAQEDTIAGYTIPVGAQVIVPIWGLHHDERYWDRPYAFDPDRWTREQNDERPRYSFLPFGGGNRVCVGEQFARMEMQVVLATLLQRFNPRTLIDTPPHLNLLVTMRPETPIRIELQAR